jgi:TonB family protein
MLQQLLAVSVLATFSLSAIEVLANEGDPSPSAASTASAPAAPEFTRSVKGWTYDANTNCWALDPSARSNLGFSWTGGCTDNRISGDGTLTWSDANPLTFGDLQTMTGKFASGLLDGPGTARWSDGRIYEGTFKDSIPDGAGKMHWRDGNYEGQFHFGKFEGRGILVVDGRKLDGEFRYSELITGHYSGVMPDGSRYDGEIKNGWNSWYGTLTFISGTYEGRFHQNDMSGPGVLHRLDGTTLTGIAEPAREDSNPPVQITYPPLSRRLSEQGRAVITYVVQTDGQVTDVKLAVSSGWERLDKAATETVAAMHYVPARMAGVPIAITKTKVVTYKLR